MPWWWSDNQGKSPNQTPMRLTDNHTKPNANEADVSVDKISQCRTFRSLLKEIVVYTKFDSASAGMEYGDVPMPAGYNSLPFCQ
jgi:hypothetical protein